MKKVAILLLAVIAMSANTVQGSTEKLELFFKLSDYFLKRHVYKGLVNYEYAARNTKEIDLLHEVIGQVDLSSASESQKKAFYINSYNILVIYQVTKSYPIKNPLDQEGFFDQIKYNVAGESITLNELETERMIATYKEPRFHFVLACAAMSCPKLANFAFKPETLEQSIDERSRLAMNDDQFIQVDAGSRKVRVSKIFEWYKGDFEKTGLSIIDYINQYRTNKIPSGYKVDYYEYDWTLNERKS